MPTREFCAIHQPNFFPRLATLGKIISADCWVVLDNVQFVRRDYQHRCRIATVNNPLSQQWLSLSVHLPQGRATPINRVRIVDCGRCHRRISGLLAQYYARSPYWPQLRTVIESVLDTLIGTCDLAAVAEASTRGLLDMLGWTGTILHSSDLVARSHRSQRLADLTRAAGCTTYLYGTGGASYLDFAPFSRAGLRARPYQLPSGLLPPGGDTNRLSALASFAYTEPQTLAYEILRYSWWSQGKFGLI